MARIQIKDLPKDQKISREEMRNISGGGFFEDQGKGLDNAFELLGDDIKKVADWVGNAVSGGGSGTGSSGGGADILQDPERRPGATPEPPAKSKPPLIQNG